jgi:antitoxin VapB
MTLNIRNPEADALARRLAEIESRPITEAVILALREAIARRLQQEDPRQTARDILARHGVRPMPGARIPLPDSVWDELDSRR